MLVVVLADTSLLLSGHPFSVIFYHAGLISNHLHPQGEHVNCRAQRISCCCRKKNAHVPCSWPPAGGNHLDIYALGAVCLLNYGEY